MTSIFSLRWFAPERNRHAVRDAIFAASSNTRHEVKKRNLTNQRQDNADELTLKSLLLALAHMDATFETIGLEVPSEKAINFLAERAENQGEPTQILRRGAVLHGRCWKLGDGLEVWTVLYESETGDVFYANCRPGFRARYTQRIGPWALTEYDEEGEAVIHGYCDGTDTEVLFELQNLTEVGAAGFRVPALHVGLCGLAYRARVCSREMSARWLPLERAVPSRAAHENDWILRGRVIAFKPLRNPLSGSELYWVYVDLRSEERRV